MAGPSKSRGSRASKRDGAVGSGGAVSSEGAGEEFPLGWRGWLLTLLLVLCAPSLMGGCDDDDEDCNQARQDCHDAGMCWSYATTDKRNGGGSFSPSTQEVGAHGEKASSCDIVCSNCETMAEVADVPPPVSDLDRAILSLAEQECERWYTCQPRWVPQIMGEREYCVAERVEFYNFVSTLPGSVITESSILDCASEHTKIGCTQYDVECFTGTKKNGENCLFNLQCESGDCEAYGYECGACREKTLTGDPCEWDSNCSEENDYCRDGICTAYSEEGEPCGEDEFCASYHTCVDGICERSSRQVDQSCGPEEGKPYCEATEQVLGCHADEHICKPATVANPGDSCPAFGWCGGAGSCVDGICAAGPGPGEACSEDAVQGCRWPAICVDGTCRGIPSENLCGP